VEDDFLEQLAGLRPPEPGGERPWPVARTNKDFRAVQVQNGHKVWVGRIPDELAGCDFDELWDLHPDHFPSIMMYSTPTNLPRWQQAYHRDYVFSGQRNQALPTPAALGPFVEWAQGLHPRLDAPLLNWYDPGLEHYIGKHRDSTIGLIPGSPIVTMSLGGERVFRLRPFRAPGGCFDLEVGHGDVVILPWETNLAVTHEVPHFARFKKRRISVTFRAFS